MNNHDTIRALAIISKYIRTAKEFCRPMGVDYLNMADSLVHKLGDSYGKEFAKEITNVHEDA